MYELVPPKSKLIEYTSPHYSGVVFKIKILDFEEDEKQTELLLLNAKKENGEFIKDDNGNYLIDNEQYYIDCFKLFVKEIDGIEGKFSPSWRLLKDVVNKAITVNSVTEVEK